jgi:hypothetical protein
MLSDEAAIVMPPLADGPAIFRNGCAAGSEMFSAYAFERSLPGGGFLSCPDNYSRDFAEPF